MVSDSRKSLEFDLNKTYNLLERITRPSLVEALSYLNAGRNNEGQEDFVRKWFKDINILSWNSPFFRHVDGRDHSHFVLDIDIRRVGKNDKRANKQYLERIRNVKLAAGINYFSGWVQDHKEHQFLWKVGGTGLHAIQRINKRADRRPLKDLVMRKLFPRCGRVIYHNQDEIPENEYKKGHHCNHLCDGWHYSYSHDKEEKVYRKDLLDWVKFYKYEGETYKFIIDLRLFQNDRQLIRWVFSPYFGIPGRTYFSIPLYEWSMEYVTKYSTAEHIAEILKPFEVPLFSYNDYVDLPEIEDEDWLIQKTPTLSDEDPENTLKTITIRDQDRKAFDNISVRLYNVGDELPSSLEYIMDRMTSTFTRKETSPCIREHYRRASKTRGAHWNRFPIIRFLMAQGFNIHQVANWIRFRLNDEVDNLPENRSKLMTNLPVVVGDPNNPHKIAGCRVLQTPGNNFQVCNEKMKAACGRPHPLSKKTLNKYKKKYNNKKIREEIPQVTNQPDPDGYWDQIVNKLDEALDRGRNMVLWKATRAGVTTTMIYSAFRRNKKLLVLVPTNKIALDTFQKALNIVKSKSGQTINGGILASNNKSCLKLKFMKKELDAKNNTTPGWGEDYLAWDRMIYHQKPECSNCRFRNATISLPFTNNQGELIPIYESLDRFPEDPDTNDGWCAYQTFIRNIHQFDVVFLTYAKLQSLRTTPSKDNEFILRTLMEEFELLFLDEINTVAQGSPLGLKLFQHPTSITSLEDQLDYDLFVRLRNELIELSLYAQTKTSQKIQSITEKFVNRFEPLKLRDWWSDNAKKTGRYDVVSDAPINASFRHPLDYHERQELKDQLSLYHVVLENYAKDHNKLLWGIERVLMILVHDEYVGYNLPEDQDSYVNFQFVVSPNIQEIRGFVRNYTNENDTNMVLATDACLPEANVSDILGVNFENFMVGDPRKTNAHQLIVADTNQVFSSELVYGSRCSRSRCEYWNANEAKCELTRSYYVRNEVEGEPAILKTVTALKNGQSYKARYRLLNDLQSLINAYGAENIFIVFPNKKSRYWFRKYGMRQLNDAIRLKHSYYRSDLTIGVECDRRIMVTVGSPIPPKNSHIWLAYYYHRLGLLPQYSILDLAERLRVNSMRSAFWQTAGRAKDPMGLIRSFVVAWGLSAGTLIEAFKFHSSMRDSLPNYIAIDSNMYKEETMLGITNIWRKSGIILTPAMEKIIRFLSQKGNHNEWFSSRDLYNKCSIKYEIIKRLSNRYSRKELEYLNLEMRKRDWGSRQIIDIRYVLPVAS